MTEDTGRVAPKAPPARLWWIMLARAAVALLLGLSVLLLGSLLTLRWVARHRGERGSRLAWAAAVAGILAGVLVLAREALQDVLSANVVLGLLGLTAILTGLLRLSGTFHDHVVDDRPRLPHRVALGVLELALGVALLLADRATRPVAIAAGLWAIVGGTIMLVDALALRRMARPFG